MIRVVYMKIKNLKPNRRNPRKISPAQQKALKMSLEKFGDLSGIVFNRTTGNLVGGHQRSKVIPQDASIVIDHKYDVPTTAGTVSEGHVEFNGEKFKYREVVWGVDTEVEAMLAANNQGGENDDGLLKIVLADFPKLDLTLAGLPELMPLQPLRPQQNDFTLPEESDEEYVANTPQTTEAIDQERIPSTDNVSPFDAVVEKSEVEGKRFVIIIDCRDQAAKDSLKNDIKSLVETAGAKFF
jgi:hypothetical protein